MKISEDTIEYLCSTSMIEMGQEEKNDQRKDLERIVAYAEKIAELDTTGLPEQSHPFGPGINAVNYFREDVVTNSDQTETWTKAAPDSKGSYIRVPRTVEE